MVVILIEATNLLRFFRSLQLFVHGTMFPAAMHHYCQATIGPQLALASEPVRCLNQGHRLRDPKRANERNLAQDFHGLLLPALGQEFSSHRVPQSLQSIRLLTVEFCAAKHPVWGNLFCHCSR